MLEAGLVGNLRFVEDDNLRPLGCVGHHADMLKSAVRHLAVHVDGDDRLGQGGKVSVSGFLADSGVVERLPRLWPVAGTDDFAAAGIGLDERRERLQLDG